MQQVKIQAPRTGRRRAGVHSDGGATLADVAAAAGVSQMTVSRVINGGPASAAAKENVRRAVAQLDYTPNQAARALAAGRGKRRRQSDGPAASAMPFPDLWRPYEKLISEMWGSRS